MLKKINKLINYSKKIDNNIYNKLIVIAERISNGKKYLLINIKEMESIVSPEKVDSKDNRLEKVELEL
jgi:hypothetical protein